MAGIFTKFRRKQPIPFQQWTMLGQAKIALKVPTTRDLVRACERLHIVSPYTRVRV